MATVDKLLWGDRDDPRRELAALFPGDARASGTIHAREWARGVVAEAGIAAEDELGVIRALRDAEPRLSLKPARYLAAQLRG